MKDAHGKTGRRAKSGIKTMALVAVVLLGLLSTGRSAPATDCDGLTAPITISNEAILGKWFYIGGSSYIPGSRSLGRLLTSVWLNVTATTQSNVLNIIQTQRVFGECSSLTYNVTFENSTMTIEQPFYLKEVYLPTNCSNCLVVDEEVVSGTTKFNSFMLFSRSTRVSPDVVESFKKQAKCVYMPEPIMMDPDTKICPDNIPPSDGLSALNSLLEAKMGHQVARFIDALLRLFDDD